MTTMSQEWSSYDQAFVEARKMIANDLYVPSSWGRIEVDNSGEEPTITYSASEEEPANVEEEAVSEGV